MVMNRLISAKKQDFGVGAGCEPVWRLRRRRDWLPHLGKVVLPAARRPAHAWPYSERPSAQPVQASTDAFRAFPGKPGVVLCRLRHSATLKNFDVIWLVGYVSASVCTFAGLWRHNLR
jgi:hypothetical protein